MIAVMLVGSLIAGLIDALIGGGGLILLPLILICNPQFSNAEALGVNKVAAIVGTGSAAVTLGRMVESARRSIRYAPLALIGAGLGALVASNVDKQVMRPIIAVLLVLVGTYVLLKPSFGQSSKRNSVTTSRILAVCAAVLAIGIYDGAMGPGTGVFFIMAFTSIRGGDFLENAAWAKIANTFTNLGALVVFSLHGEIYWGLGLALAVANVIGAQIGARMVLAKGGRDAPHPHPCLGGGDVCEVGVRPVRGVAHAAVVLNDIMYIIGQLSGVAFCLHRRGCFSVLLLPIDAGRFSSLFIFPYGSLVAHVRPFNVWTPSCNPCESPRRYEGTGIHL